MNPAFEIPDEDADDVGVDQAPNLRFAFREIAVGVRKRQRALLLGFEQAHVFDRDHRLVGEGLEKRDLFVVRTVGSPFAVPELFQWACPRAATASQAWCGGPRRFALLLPTGYSLSSAARSWT